MKASQIYERRASILHATQWEKEMYFHNGLSWTLNLQPATAVHLSVFGAGREEAGTLIDIDMNHLNRSRSDSLLWD